MQLHTHTIGSLAGVTAATLSETTADTSTLSLRFAGFGPDWLRYMEPVTLYHGGRCIFHGKVTALERTNSGGEVTSAATISNFLWLLERQTLGQQVAEIKANADDGSPISTIAGSGASGGVVKRPMFAGQIGKWSGQAEGNSTWGSLVRSMAVSSAGWMPPGCVAEGGGSRLLVKASGAVSGRTVWAVTDRLITTASALHKLRRKSPDVQYILDYEAGTVTATAIGDMEAMTIDSSRGGLLAAEGIAPQYEAQVTGVAIAYTNDEGKVRLYRYPSGLDMAADGVKVFSLSGGYFVRSWKTVAREYYEAANELQWGGSVTLLQSAVERSPLGGTLNLTGPGCHPEWATMRAVVTSAEWDFMQGTLTLGLGREFSDPEFADAEEHEDGGEETGMEGDGGDPGGEEGSETGSGTWPDIPPPTWSETETETQTETGSEEGSQSQPYGSQSYQWSGTESQGSQSQGSQSQSGGTQTGGGGGGGGVPPGTETGSKECNCPLAQYNNPHAANQEGHLLGVEIRADMGAYVRNGLVIIPLANYYTGAAGAHSIAGALEKVRLDSVAAAPSINSGELVLPGKQLADLERRVAALEAAGGGGGCNCTCNVTLEDIEAAIAEQLGEISWQLETTGLLEQNEYGSLSVTTTGTGGVDGGEAQTDVSY